MVAGAGAAETDAVAAADFEAFVAQRGPDLRRALTARYGVDVGAEVTADVLALAWERWPAISAMANPTGYLYRAGQSAARRYRHRPVVLAAAPNVAFGPSLDAAIAKAASHASDAQPFRQTRRSWLLAAAVVAVVAAIGIGFAITASRGGHAASVTAGAPTTAPPVHPKVTFSMRLVQSFSDKQPCQAGELPGTGAAEGCYQLGPVLLDNSDIVAASASSDVDGWGLDVTFTGARFPVVMQESAGQQLAILIDGSVVSAPHVNPGITGRIARVSGDFNEQTAKRLAAELNPPGSGNPGTTTVGPGD